MHGINNLAQVLQERTLALTPKENVLDFGTIQPDMSLITNKYPEPIPMEDYLICRSVSYNPIWLLTETYSSSEHSSIVSNPNPGGIVVSPGSEGIHSHGPGGEHGGHTSGSGTHVHDSTSETKHKHAVLLPEKMRRIQPDDRVLVAWVGDDPVIVDIVLPAREML